MKAKLALRLVLWPLAAALPMSAACGQTPHTERNQARAAGVQSTNTPAATFGSTKWIQPHAGHTLRRAPKRCSCVNAAAQRGQNRNSLPAMLAL